MILLNKVSVIGAGAWGCALANVLSQKHQQITLFSSRSDFVESFNRSHASTSLSKVDLSKNITATTDFSFLNESEIIFIVSSATKAEEILQTISKKISRDTIVVLCSKGFTNEGELFSQIFQCQLPQQKFAILSGPNFAMEVAQKKLSTTTVASQNLSIAHKISNIISTSYFIPKISQDIITTQIAGTIKNIIAICCGLVDGLNLGTNCKAAVINKGLGEIFYISESLGGKPYGELASPAVLGDLFLTCSSNKSRNYSYGFNIALGDDSKNLGITCEGVRAVKILPKFFNKYQINQNQLKLCLLVLDVVNNNIEISNLEERIFEII